MHIFVQQVNDSSNFSINNALLYRRHNVYLMHGCVLFRSTHRLSYEDMPDN